MNLKKFCLMLLVFSCLLLPLTAYAAGGNGGGKGNGGGGGNGSGSGSTATTTSTSSADSEGLTLVSSTPADGTHDVKLPVQINLTFSNNVVNMTVKDDNVKCFVLASSDGTSIPVEIKMADDQVEPDKKRDVVLVPKEDLKLNTEYTVTISSALKSKNGETLGKDVKVTFDTGKPAAAGTGNTDTAKPAAGNADSANTEGNSTVTVVIIAIAVVLAAAVVFGLSRKNRK